MLDGDYRMSFAVGRELATMSANVPMYLWRGQNSTLRNRQYVFLTLSVQPDSQSHELGYQLCNDEKATHTVDFKDMRRSSSVQKPASEKGYGLISAAPTRSTALLPLAPCCILTLTLHLLARIHITIPPFFPSR